jgi:hypothetical protein
LSHRCIPIADRVRRVRRAGREASGRRRGAELRRCRLYEKRVGVAYGEVAPDHPLNAGIVTLDRAPHTAQGMVEYAIDVDIRQATV